MNSTVEHFRAQLHSWLSRLTYFDSNVVGSNITGQQLIVFDSEKPTRQQRNKSNKAKCGKSSPLEAEGYNTKLETVHEPWNRRKFVTCPYKKKSWFTSPSLIPTGDARRLLGSGHDRSVMEKTRVLGWRRKVGCFTSEFRLRPFYKCFNAERV